MNTSKTSVISVVLGLAMWVIITLLILKPNDYEPVVAFELPIVQDIEDTKEEPKEYNEPVITGVVKEKVVEKAMPIILVKNSDTVSDSMKTRLRYYNYHSTFDRNVEIEYDYTVWWEWLDPIVNYAINKTKNLPHPNWGLMWLDLAKTRSIESSMYNVSQRWAWDEIWICQLRYTYHKNFMDSSDFSDPYNQIDYCVDVYLDWYYRLRGKRSISSVRSARAARNSVSNRFNKL